MTLPVHSVSAAGAYGVPAEWGCVFRTLSVQPRPPALFCHGANGTALASYGNAGERDMILALAQRYTVMVADLGFNTFGNDTNTERITQVLGYLSGTWGASGPAVLVGASMGGCNVLNYALRFPERVKAVAGVIPGIDLGDIWIRDPLGTRAVLDSAYPPDGYNDAEDGPMHSPAHFVGSLDPSLPISLWYSDDDPIIDPDTVATFGAIRPQTLVTSIGARGHSAASVGFAVDGVMSWLDGL